MNTVIECLSADPGFMLGAILGTLGILAATTMVVSSVMATHWRVLRETQESNALKREMLDRGMSAEEIAEVIKARPTSSFWAK